MKAQSLIGKYARTMIAVPATGRILAYSGQCIDEYTAQTIARLPSVIKDIVQGIRPDDIFQTWQAKGTQLVDDQGKVY